MNVNAITISPRDYVVYRNPDLFLADEPADAICQVISQSPHAGMFRLRPLRASSSSEVVEAEARYVRRIPDARIMGEIDGVQGPAMPPALTSIVTTLITRTEAQAVPQLAPGTQTV